MGHISSINQKQNKETKMVLEPHCTSIKRYLTRSLKSKAPNGYKTTLSNSFHGHQILLRGHEIPLRILALLENLSFLFKTNKAYLKTSSNMYAVEKSNAHIKPQNATKTTYS